MKRILLIIGIIIIVLLEIRPWNVRVSENSGNPVEITKEATATGTIIAGEVATVKYVIDGDTIELTDGRRVRYIGIDAPEKDECFSVEAKVENKRLVENKTVRLERDISDKDGYGRLLRNVFVNTIIVNKALVEGGFARAWNVPPDEKYKDSLFVSQLEARGAGRGLWQLCR